jgi:hypothetical protein
MEIPMSKVSLQEIQERIKDVQKRSEQIKGKINSEEESALNNLHRDGKTRSWLTIGFLMGFFSLLIGCFLFVLLYNSLAVGWVIDLNSKGLVDEASSVKLLELEKVLSVIIGVLGTPLGFIIGYYFKEKNK